MTPEPDAGRDSRGARGGTAIRALGARPGFAGISVAASVSAPSQLTIDRTEEAGTRFPGFVRGGSFRAFAAAVEHCHGGGRPGIGVHAESLDYEPGLAVGTLLEAQGPAAIMMTVWVNDIFIA
jgi:hypothetical protein